MVLGGLWNLFLTATVPIFFKITEYVDIRRVQSAYDVQEYHGDLDGQFSINLWNESAFTLESGTDSVIVDYVQLFGEDFWYL